MRMDNLFSKLCNRVEVQISTRRDRRYRVTPESGLVSFTMDDGSIVDYERMLPVFTRYNAVAVSAVITDKIGMPGYLTAQHIVSLQNIGWEIMSHTKTHPNLANLEEESVDYELQASKNYLQSMGIDVHNLVYPYSSLNSTVYKLALRHYRSALSWSGINRSPFCLHTLKRIPLGSYTKNGQNTFEYYKKCVNVAITKRSWVIFEIHPYHIDHDATQQRYLEEVLEYCGSQNVPIVTVNQGLDIIERLADATI